MTSIFDQYEEASREAAKISNLSAISRLTSRYRMLSVDNDDITNEEIPILNVTPMDYMPVVANRLQHLAVSEEMIAFNTTSNILYYHNRYKREKTTKELDINKVLGLKCKIKHLFLEPVHGNHILLSLISSPNVNSSPTATTSCDLFYMNASVTNLKLKQVNKMRGYEVTAVGWNRLNANHQCTAPMLLGTSKGLIFETELNAESDKLFQSGVETYCRQVFDIGRNSSNAVITGLEFYKFSNENDKYFILVTTVSRLYQFVGHINSIDEKPLLLQLFNNYLNIPEGFVEMPNENVWSQLHVCFIKKPNDKSLYPKSFGWHIDRSGVMYAELQSEWCKGLSNVSVQYRNLDYKPLSPPPIGFVVTEFHVLFLYSDRVVIKSVVNVNQEVVSVKYIDELNYGRCIAISRNPKGIIFILTERTILVGELYAEDRHIWKIYLDLGDFIRAKEYCHNNLTHLFVVLKKEAEFYFNCRKYKESASLYAQIDGISFEEISLKFLQSKQTEALKLYLLKTLEKLKNHDRAHVTMITFWLLEIYEKQLADAKYNDGAVNELNFDELLSLPNAYNCIKNNKEAVYKILNSHGDSENLIKLAHTFNDHEKVIRHFLEEGRVHDALDVLQSNPSVALSKNLIFIFMPELLSMAPKETIDLLKKMGNKIETLKILPYLIFPYNSENDLEILEVIGYLEYCILSLHSHDEAVHNYLITLYAKYKPDKIIQYLASHGQDASMVSYDIRYALKLCQKINLTEACVQLSAMLGLWECAVDLALTISTDLAKQTVQTVSQMFAHNNELCKKLWLKIAQHVVNECNDIKQSMEFLQQCDLVKIEDVLPFFNDFVTIDHFKDAICSSLKEYNKHIEILKEEMEDATKSAEVIRNDIQSFRNRYAIVQSTDVCCSCNIQLLLRPFYIFPCTHYFHADCLIRELTPYLNESDIMRIEYLQRQLMQTTVGVNNDGTSFGSNSINLKEQYKTELDSIVATECFFCGSVLIEQIDRPFVEEDDFEKIQLDWE